VILRLGQGIGEFLDFLFGFNVVLLISEFSLSGTRY